MSLNQPENPWLVRTDFSNEEVWVAIRKLVCLPQIEPLSGMECYANLETIDEPRFKDKVYRDIVGDLPDDYPGYVVFLVDTETITNKELPILVMDFSFTDQIKSLRAIPSAIQSIENNLSLGNMDFDDFYNARDYDGIFRSFLK